MSEELRRKKVKDQKEEDQRRILRDRRPSTTACQLAARWEQRIEIVYSEEKKFCTWPTRAAKAGQKYLVPARQAQRTNQGRTSFVYTILVPIYGQNAKKELSSNYT